MFSLRFLFPVVFLLLVAASAVDAQLVVQGEIPSDPDFPGTRLDAELQLGGQSRQVVLVAPAGEPPKRGRPVWIYLHGSGEEARDSTAFRREFLELTDRAGWLSVFPEATRVEGVTRWNNTFDPTRPDDVTFILGLVDAIETQYADEIDPRRIYLSGFSGGGGAVHNLAALHPDRFAAATMIGTSIGSTTMDGVSFRAPEPSGDLQVLIVNGTRDDKRTYDGGPNENGTDIVAARVAVLQWVLGMDRRPAGQVEMVHPVAVKGEGNEVFEDSSVTIERYGRRRAGPGVTFATIHRGEHVWPTIHQNDPWDGDQYIFDWLSVRKRRLGAR